MAKPTYRTPEGKVRTTIYLNEDKVKELKKKAIDAGISLSKLFEVSANEYRIDKESEVKK